jgi:hypothetical protein
LRRGLWAGAPQVGTMRTATDDEALHEMREGSQCRFAVFRPAVPSTAQHAATLSTRFIIMESYPRPPVVVPSAVKFSEKVTRAEHAESFKYQKGGDRSTYCRSRFICKAVPSFSCVHIHIGIPKLTHLRAARFSGSRDPWLSGCQSKHTHRACPGSRLKLALCPSARTLRLHMRLQRRR